MQLKTHNVKSISLIEKELSHDTKEKYVPIYNYLLQSRNSIYNFSHNSQNLQFYLCMPTYSSFSNMLKIKLFITPIYFRDYNSIMSEAPRNTIEARELLKTGSCAGNNAIENENLEGS